MSDANGDVQAVLLTALELEYAAVRTYLTNVRTRVHPAGTHFETGTVPGTPARVAIGVAGEGNRAAAVLVERANALFHPKIALFIGIAGALHTDIKLGDVVVATRTYSYHGGKAERAELLARPRSWDAPHELLQHARHLSRTPWWCQLSPSPASRPPHAIYFRPIAAGEIVLNTRTGPIVELIRRHYNDVAAIEMESAGAAEAAHLNGPLPLLTIRGISDRADGQKDATDASGTQHTAARHAAAFALALLVRLSKEGQPRASKIPPAAPAPDDRISIGVGGDISGQVVIGAGNRVIWKQSPPTHLKTEHDQADLDRMFAELHSLIAATPGNETEAAQTKLADLREAVLSSEPDLATMEHVLGWIRRKLPMLAPATLGLITHPTVHHLVTMAGPDLAREYIRRFGRPAP